jgi:hypothetical protein
MQKRVERTDSGRNPPDVTLVEFPDSGDAAKKVFSIFEQRVSVRRGQTDAGYDYFFRDD